MSFFIVKKSNVKITILLHFVDKILRFQNMVIIFKKYPCIFSQIRKISDPRFCKQFIRVVMLRTCRTRKQHIFMNAFFRITVKAIIILVLARFARNIFAVYFIIIFVEMSRKEDRFR